MNTAIITTARKTEDEFATWYAWSERTAISLTRQSTTGRFTSFDSIIDLLSMAAMGFALISCL